MAMAAVFMHLREGLPVCLIRRFLAMSAMALFGRRLTASLRLFLARSRITLRNGLTAQTGAPGGLVFITASIIAGNGINDCEGSTTTSGYNLIGDGTNCVVTPTTGDLVGTLLTPFDPLLGPLQDNGGRTSTHAVDPTSLAIDSAGLAGDLPCSDAATDQRGQTRPNGAACDIGSFEFTPPIGPLQTLINAADPGATINVPEGTYTEAITIGDGKTLAGSGPDNVVIDVTNLNSSAITASGDFTLIGISVIGGSARYGGGIFADIDGTNISLDNVVFDNNIADTDGGAVYLRNGTLTATDATFTSNSADDGNGGAIFSGTVANISGSQFNLNQAAGNGGSIFNNGTLNLADSTIENSSASMGGGLFNNTNSIATISGTTLANNNANGSGTTGGAIGGAGTLEVTNSTLSGNIAGGNSNGGGIGLFGGSARLNNVTLAFNSAAGLGGPLYAEPVEPGAFITFSNTLFAGNTGGGTDCSTVASLGYNLFENTPCPILASDIVSNPLIGVLDFKWRANPDPCVGYNQSGSRCCKPWPTRN